MPEDEIPHGQARSRAVQHGAAKFANPFVYGPRNAGKSFILDALSQICLTRPACKSNYVLQGLIGKKYVHATRHATRALAVSLGHTVGVVGGRASDCPSP